MRRVTPLLAAAALLCSGAEAAHAQGLCFRGPIRRQCTAFVVFEGSAVASTGGPNRHFLIIGPVFNGKADTIVNTVHDLSSYFSGSLGYLQVVGDRRAVGAVVELGFSNESSLGNSHRLSVVARERREIGNATVEASAGPLGVQAFRPTTRGSCCPERTLAYGGTVEGALTYRDYVGLTAGADLIHGAGRTTGALRAGVRVGSWAAVATSILLAAAAYTVISSIGD